MEKLENLTKDQLIEQVEKLNTTVKNLKKQSKIENIDLEFSVDNKTSDIDNHFKLLMDQSPSIIEIYAVDGLQVAVNKAYEVLWGFPASTTVGTFNVLKSKEVIDTGLIEYIKRAYKGESVQVPEYRFNPKGKTESGGFGRVRWLSTRVFPLKNKSDIIINIVITHEDITDRKEIEFELEKNQYYLQKAQEIGQIGTWELDIINDILTWTEENYKIFGIESGTPMNLDKFIHCVHSDDKDYVIKKWNSALKNEGFDIEHRLITNDIVKWVREKAQIEFDDKENPIKAIGFTQDITASKLINDELNKSNERFFDLFETINSGIAIYKVLNKGESGKDYIFQDINNAAEKIDNISKKEVIGKSLMELRPSIDNFGLIPIFKEVWETGTPAFFPAKQYVDNKYSNYYENRVFRLSSGEIVAIYDDVTEKENANIEVLTSKERFHMAMKASKDGLFDWNLETNNIYYSPGWKKMLGYEDSELPNDFSIWEKLTEPGDAKKSWDMLNELINKKIDRFEMEFRMKHKDGHWVIILSRAEAITNKEGKATRIIGTHVDITQRKLAEESTIINEAKFRGLFESKLIGQIFWNAEGDITDANQTFLDMMGYTFEEIINKDIDWKDMTPPEYAERDEQLLLELADVGVISPIEKEYFHKDGHRIPIMIGAATLPGQTTKGVAFILDISSQKKAELESMKLQSTLDLAQEMANIGFWNFNIKTKKPNWSDQMFVMLGVDKKNGPLSYEDHKNIWHPDDWEMFDTAVQECIKGTPYDIVIRIILPDGSLNYLNSQGFPRFDKEGNLVELFGTSIDITSLKTTEEELRKHKENLEELIVKRTEELEQKNKELDNALKVFVGREKTINELQNRIRILESNF